MSCEEKIKLLESVAASLRSAADEMDYDALELAVQRTHMALRTAFGDNSSYLRQLSSITFEPGIWPTTPQARANAFRSGVRSLSNLLKTAEEELRLSHHEPGQVLVPTARPAPSRRVFVVHGRDEALKQSVARLLAQLDLEPVILHEKPSQSRALIEKFETYADVGFAVVLLTPDDLGYERTAKPTTARPRARQNVIFELGFFIGRLHRARVAALFAGDDTFEKPSDYDGVMYIPVDTSGKWKYDLATELQVAGIEVDKNKIT